MSENGNGHRDMPPMPRDVPIVGQAFELTDWFIAFNGKCWCGEPLWVVGKVGAKGLCRKCHRVVITQGFATTPNGQIQVNLGFAMAQPVAEPATT